YMKEALREAQKAYDEGEIPVGAVVVMGGRIIGRGHNQTERLNDVTAHAEIIAISAAAQTIGAKYLPEATLYVTVEPCVMCCGAAYWEQLGKIVYGASDVKRHVSELHDRILHPKTEVVGGVLKEQCEDLMQKFFKEKR
ncbi:MAG: nucleoside deaminase, partial [Bacteroidales bacterium]|nr:nucleoside deaminase [Bacteroidales bacterium]